jgi:DHA1 family multidrug resistance protein-like MFS transporter
MGALMYSNKVHNFQFVFIFVAVTISIIGYGLIIPYLSLLKATYGVSAFAIGLVLSLYALGQFIAGPFMGDFNYRYGEKIIMIIGLIIFAITTTLTFIFDNFYLILLFRFLSGFSSAAILVSSETFVATKFNRKYITKFMSFLSVSGGFGIFLGLYLGQRSVNTASTGITPIILYYIISIFLLTILIFLFIPNQKIIKERRIDKTQKFYTYFVNLFKSIHMLSKDKVILFILYGFFTFGYTTTSLEGFGFDYVKTTYDFDTKIIILEIGIVMLYVLIYFFLINPYLESKLGHLKMLILHASTSAISLLILFFFDNIFIFTPFLIAILITISFVSSVLVAYVSDISDNPQLVLGTKNSIVSIGMIAGPIISGIFYEIQNTYLFLHLSVFFIILIVIGLMINNKK